MLTEVVLCKECKWHQKGLLDGVYRCYGLKGMSGTVKIKDDDFCSYGEKGEKEKRNG